MGQSVFCVLLSAVQQSPIFPHAFMQHFGFAGAVVVVAVSANERAVKMPPVRITIPTKTFNAFIVVSFLTDKQIGRHSIHIHIPREKRFSSE